MATLASTQHRDVTVTVAGRILPVGDKHSPGEIKSNASTHRPGGEKRWRVLAGKPSMEDGSVEFTLDPDLHFWVLAHLTDACESNAAVSITDVYRSPSTGETRSRTYNGVCGGLQEPESDSTDASPQTYTLTYTPTDLPS